MSSFSAFLRANKENYLRSVNEGKGKDWIVVMGNEAGDLDSVASSLALSWFQSACQGQQSVALMQTPRSDLHLRAENQHALSLASISHECEEILCIDDIAPVDSKAGFPSNKFALVDHNRLLARFRENNPDAEVIAVIDHHEDEGLYHETAKPRIVQVPTGSCTALVTDYIWRTKPDSAPAIPTELATLLLCGILIDTAGLKQGGKAEKVDRTMAAVLYPLSVAGRSGSADFSASSLNNGEDTDVSSMAPIKELFGTLSEKKASVSHLSSLDLLRRDYKQYTLTCSSSWSKGQSHVEVGLSTVPWSLKDWIPRDGVNFWIAIEKYMADQQLTILGILTSFEKKKKHKRQGMIIFREDASEELEKRVWEGLEGSEELRLKQKLFDKYAGDGGMQSDIARKLSRRARLYKQRNAKATRKAVAPLMKNIIEGS